MLQHNTHNSCARALPSQLNQMKSTCHWTGLRMPPRITPWLLRPVVRVGRSPLRGPSEATRPRLVQIPRDHGDDEEDHKAVVTRQALRSPRIRPTPPWLRRQENAEAAGRYRHCSLRFQQDGSADPHLYIRAARSLRTFHAQTEVDLPQSSPKAIARAVRPADARRHGSV